MWEMSCGVNDIFPKNIYENQIIFNIYGLLGPGFFSWKCSGEV